jgi:hypothetical protein
VKCYAAMLLRKDFAISLTSHDSVLSSQRNPTSFATRSTLKRYQAHLFEIALCARLVMRVQVILL